MVIASVPLSLDKIELKLKKIVSSRGNDITGCSLFSNEQIDESLIAITTGSEGGKIIFADLIEKKTKKIIDVGVPNDGMAVYGGWLYFSAGTNGLMRVNIIDGSIREVLYKPMCGSAYIAVFGNNLYFTNKSENTVTCSDLVSFPLGISLDHYGNVYVVGNKFANVVVISPDGKRSKTILTSAEGLDCPQMLIVLWKNLYISYSIASFRIMANNSFVCGICDFRQITKPSVIWCSECDEGLCQECTEHHSISKATKGHRISPVKEYNKLPPTILEITQTCKVHNEKFQIYCNKHDCPCCKKCIVETHNECKEFVDIDDVVKNVKSSNAFVEIEHTLAEISENIKRIKKDREENLKSIKETREDIESQIKVTKQKIVNYLDQLQEDILKELSDTVETESNQIRKLLTSVQQTEKDVTEYQNNFANIKQHASDLQAFLYLKQIEQDVDGKDKLIQTLVENKNLNCATLSWNASSNVQNFQTCISTFGEIVVESKLSSIFIGSRKNKQAQFQSTVWNINQRKLKT
ncbi:unnamed protein product [Mytilus edulis]|uniref:B box-type domain-containing protein n=1 Tax=Mytilus edulis TaxID=6550 RepID=A0A8S3UMM1_MYTED|nr:unnamed protein product [Mytilus edulis]